MIPLHHYRLSAPRKTRISIDGLEVRSLIQLEDGGIKYGYVGIEPTDWFSDALLASVICTIGLAVQSSDIGPFAARVSVHADTQTHFS